MTGKSIERKKKMHKSKKDYQQIVNLIREGIWEINAAGYTTFVNPMIAEMLEYSVEEMLNCHLSFFMREEDNELAKKFLERCKQGIKKQQDFEFLKKDGQHIDTYLETSPIFDKNGTYTGTLMFVMDLTARKKTEQKILHTLQYADKIVETVREPLLVLDKNLKVVSANASFYQTFKTKPEETKGKFIYSLGNHQWDIPELRKLLQEILPMKKFFENFEVEHVFHTIGPKNMFLNARQVDEVELILLAIEDKTKQKRTEEALRESEEKYRLLAEHSADVIYKLNIENEKFTYVSPSIETIFGYTPEELLSLKPKDVLTSKSYRKQIKAMQKEISTGGKSSGTLQLDAVHKDGHIFPIEIHATFIPNKKGEPVEILGVARDITERKKTEMKLKNSYKQLRNLSRHLQSVREDERIRLAREIHDELGQVLTSIKIDVRLLNDALPIEEKKTGLQLKSINRLLDRAIDSGKKICGELRPTILDDLGLLAAIEWEGKEFEKRTGIKCNVIFQPEEITVDKEISLNVFRILQETLTNIVQHAHATKIEIEMKRKGLLLILTIKDNGRGITKKQISKQRSFGLMGIRERTEFLGGKVTIRGIPKKGTTLSIRIPLAKKQGTLND